MMQLGLWRMALRRVPVRLTCLLACPPTPTGEIAGADAVVIAAGVWTELALAYAVHKSFIFIRVPLTAAVTPKVVKVLRGWGWNIGKKGKPKISMPPSSV